MKRLILISSRLLSVSIIPLLLSSCVKYVNVPVYSCPTPPAIELPILKTDKLSLQATENEILGAITYDFIKLKKLNQQCTTILQGYSTKVQALPIQPNK